MSFFREVSLAADDPILTIPLQYAADPRSFKVNLGVGAYRDAEAKPLVLNCVQRAERQILNQHLGKDYSPIDGDPELLRLTSQLILGGELFRTHSEAIWSAQTVGGSNALRTGAEFLSRWVSHTIFISQPSWPNHKTLFERAGLHVESYPYVDLSSGCKMNFSGMCEAIQNMSPGSVILLQACCHNPSGVDPTVSQWKELSSLIKKQRLIPFFDLAYQGFGTDLEQDAEAIRLFIAEGHELLIAYSFSKNFGLYGERVGCLLVVSPDKAVLPNIASQMKLLIRGNYSNPPLQGGRIVSTILKSPELTSEWQTELKNMRDRVGEMRNALIAALLVHCKDNEIGADSLHRQRGLFSLIGLTTEQTQTLKHRYGIYLPPDGRINIAGLTTHNVDYVAKSIASLHAS